MRTNGLCINQKHLHFHEHSLISISIYSCPPRVTDQDELEELGEGLGLDRRSMVFIPVNDAEEFFSGCTHWYVCGWCFFFYVCV